MTNQSKQSRYDAFCKELTELCRRHGVQIEVYDGCAVGVVDMLESGEAINASRGVYIELCEIPLQSAIEWMERQRREDAEKTK